MFPRIMLACVLGLAAAAPTATDSFEQDVMGRRLALDESWCKGMTKQMCGQKANIDSCHLSSNCLTASCTGTIGSNLTFGIGYDLDLCGTGGGGSGDGGDAGGGGDGDGDGAIRRLDGSAAQMAVQFQTPSYPCMGLTCDTYCLGDPEDHITTLPDGVTYVGEDSAKNPTKCVYEIKADTSKEVSVPIPGMSICAYTGCPATYKTMLNIDMSANAGSVSVELSIDAWFKVLGEDAVTGADICATFNEYADDWGEPAFDIKNCPFPIELYKTTVKIDDLCPIGAADTQCDLNSQGDCACASDKDSTCDARVAQCGAECAADKKKPSSDKKKPSSGSKSGGGGLSGGASAAIAIVVLGVVGAAGFVGYRRYQAQQAEQQQTEYQLQLEDQHNSL